MTPIPNRPASISTLRRLSRDQATGVLRLRSEDADDLDLYTMGGEVISACGLADDWLFGRLAYASGMASEAALAAAAEKADQMALPDALVDDGILSIEQLQELQGECFRDNLVQACIIPWRSADFAPEDAVFPPNMQLGFDTGGFLDFVETWYETVRPLRILMIRGRDPMLSRIADAPPAQGDAAEVDALVAPRRLASAVMATSPLVGFRTLAALIERIADGGIAVDGQRLSGDGLASVTGELEAVDTSHELVGEGATADTIALDPADDDELQALEMVEADDAVETLDGVLEEPTVGRGVDRAIDYDRVEAGGHVKVYDVLDKVDLSHVETFPGSEEVLAVEEDDEELEIAGAESTLEIEGGAEPEVFSSLEEASDPSAELAMGEADPAFDDVDTSDVPPIHLSGTEESIEMVFDVDEEEPPLPPLGPAIGKSLMEQLPAIGFEAKQLDAFERRIAVFNRIFRVVFDAFAGSLGKDATRERFDSFLRDDSLQFPELFTGLHVNADGTLDAAGLVQNLASGHPTNSDSFLHQGLYELIYVHLYDAKDVLSPDGEREMMDQIAAYEEELHRR